MESEILVMQIMPKSVESGSVIQLTCKQLHGKQKQDFGNSVITGRHNLCASQLATLENKNHQDT